MVVVPTNICSNPCVTSIFLTHTARVKTYALVGVYRSPAAPPKMTFSFSALWSQLLWFSVDDDSNALDIDWDKRTLRLIISYKQSTNASDIMANLILWLRSFSTTLIPKLHLLTSPETQQPITLSVPCQPPLPHTLIAIFASINYELLDFLVTETGWFLIEGIDGRYCAQPHRLVPFASTTREI